MGCDAIGLLVSALSLLRVATGCISRPLHPVWDAPPFLRIFAQQRPDMPSQSPLVFKGSVLPQRSIRFSDRVLKEVDTVWRTRGFASPTAFIRYAVKQELSERQEGLTGAEERIAATLLQVRKDVYRVGRAQQALFAYVDTLAKALLTCVPEPRPRRGRELSHAPRKVD